ncbi:MULTISPECIES: hypothetical protein [Bifidobacterium]|uniref:hypothetical protein n=1 Tax=Bifidobacterium TaxID=1678 RepID=UPI001BDD21F3|nr:MULTISPECIES: hypothetical protein [Bifidobacterium]MBT1162006.1 hypothetical protein [Bifidobacterium sp. SO1]MBW3079085.1 hypothetical protein [Bifidobacterium simiiventris]
MHQGSGSIVASRTAFTPTGSPRPNRPGQLDPAIVAGIAGGADPSVISEISHTSAAALLDRVHHTADPEVVSRVLTLVDHEGIDLIAELWSHAEPDSLPGILWRLYLLRTWMRKQDTAIARLWRLGEPVATAASAIAGVDDAPTEDDIARTADSILAGAFVGDFAVALERAAAFTDVVALGLRVEAKRLNASAKMHDGRAIATEHDADDRPTTDAHAADATARSAHPATRAARMLHTASNLMVTSRDFRHGANLWRRGKLE